MAARKAQAEKTGGAHKRGEERPADGMTEQAGGAGDRPAVKIERPMLYLVGTPLGNLGDMTLRGLETLRGADVIASEDTRHTGLLLNRYGIKKPQISFHEHNEERSAGRIMGLLAEGKAVALVTDAGMPGIADPGFTLVRRAAAEGFPVTTVPGPTALVSALLLSGLPLHSFTFRGFPPRKPGPRRRFLEVDRESPHTLIFYESPYRVRDLLAAALGVFGDREAAVANDLTKLFETVHRGRLSALAAALQEEKPRGEYVLVIAGALGAAGAATAEAEEDEARGAGKQWRGRSGGGPAREPEDAGGESDGWDGADGLDDEWDELGGAEDASGEGWGAGSHEGAEE